MALKTILVDDLDETEGADTRDFALDGVEYEIDLNDKNAEKLKNALAPFIAVARKKRARSTVAKRASPRASAPSEQLSAIRDWAKSKGIKVSDRGRIPRKVIQQFEDEHNAAVAVLSSPK